jgi:hypothetical protein
VGDDIDKDFLGMSVHWVHTPCIEMAEEVGSRDASDDDYGDRWDQ